jgi:hypothetical protein
MKRLLEADIDLGTTEKEGEWDTLCDDLVRAVVTVAPELLLPGMFCVCRHWYEALERDAPNAPYWRAWFQRKPGYSMYRMGDPTLPYATSWKTLVRLQPMLKPTYFARTLHVRDGVGEFICEHELVDLPTAGGCEHSVPLHWRRSKPAYSYKWYWHPKEGGITINDRLVFLPLPRGPADKTSGDYFLDFI